MGLPSVLIVDENASRRSDTHGLLSGLGFPVAGEASGAQALVLARGLRPGVVLIAAHETNGVWVTARAVAEARIAAVVAVAPDALGEAARTAPESGAHGFVSYPLRATDVLAALRIADARFRETLALEGEVRGLNAQMEARRMLGRAKAILMERHQLTEREAFHRIQNQSAVLNRPTQEIARAIITAHELGPPPTSGNTSAEPRQPWDPSREGGTRKRLNSRNVSNSPSSRETIAEESEHDQD